MCLVMFCDIVLSFLYSLEGTSMRKRTMVALLRVFLVTHVCVCILMSSTHDGMGWSLVWDYASPGHTYLFLEFGSCHFSVV